MIDIILIAALAILTACILKNVKKSKNQEKEETSYVDNNTTPQFVNEFKYKPKMLLTKTEYKFYMSIRPICEANNIRICPKVRLEDFIETTATGKEFNIYRNMIKSRHVDFLLTDYNLKIIAAIELDDYTHNYNKAKETDEFKNKLYNQINIPLYRINVNSNYEESIYNIVNSLY